MNLTSSRFLPRAQFPGLTLNFLFRKASWGRVAPCLEVFPQATARVLGSGAVHKSKTGGIEAQLAEAARFTEWPSGDAEMAEFEMLGLGDRHDRLDAYLSAWVAALEEEDRRAFGAPPDDVIWTPRVGDGRFEKPVVKKAAVEKGRIVRREREGGDVDRSSWVVKLCPACEAFEFRKWPAGWDAHAAHRCAGLSGTEPEKRKAELRRWFLA